MVSASSSLLSVSSRSPSSVSSTAPKPADAVLLPLLLLLLLLLALSGEPLPAVRSCGRFLLADAVMVASTEPAGGGMAWRQRLSVDLLLAAVEGRPLLRIVLAEGSDSRSMV